MKRKYSYIKLIQLLGIVILIIVGISNISIDFFVNKAYFNKSAEETREEYINSQKKLLKSEIDRIVVTINSEIKRTEYETREMIKEKVYEAFSMAQGVYMKYRDEKRPAEIQDIIVEGLRDIRFQDGLGYFFIGDLEGTNILDPIYPHLEGINIIDSQDSRGNYVVKNVLEIIRREGECFADVYWTKPGAGSVKDFRKISYVKIFEPYNLIIGTGIYIDDIEKELKAIFLERISEVRFGYHDEGYVFIDSYDGKVLANDSQKKLIGTNIWELTDPNGVKVIQEMRHAVENPEGDFIYYSWNKLSTNKISPKVSFVRGVEYWQWILGAGVYLDDIDDVLALKYQDLYKQEKTKIIYFISITIGIILIFLFINNWLTSQVKVDFNRFVDFFSKQPYSNREIELDHVKFSEFVYVATEANKMLRDKIRAEQNLLSEKEQLLVTIKSIGDGVITTDVKGHVILMNYVAEQLTGWENVAAFSKPLSHIFNIIHSETREPLDSTIDKVLNGDIVEKDINSLVLISKDGSEYQISELVSRIEDSSGEVTGAVLVFRDMTKEYKIQNDLIKSEERYRFLAEQPGQMVYDYDIKSSKIIWSGDIKGVTGYSEEEFRKVDIVLWEEYIHADDRKTAVELLDDAMSRGEKYHINYRFKYIDGTYKYIDDSGFFNLDKNGEACQMIGLMKDITTFVQGDMEKEELQIQLSHRNKMDAIGQLAGGVAHDFNNMIGGIMGSAELLRSSELVKSEKNKKLIEIILQASIRASDLTSKLLAFGRKGKLSSTMVDMHNAIDDSLSLLTQTIDKKISISVVKSADNYFVIGDNAGLQNALINICINAAFAMNNSGELSFKTTNIDLDKYYCNASVFNIKPGLYIQVDIRDTGCGIPQDHIQKIFEPFFTTKEQGDGSGLGLSAVYGTVLDHHGEIIVTSSSGEWTNFSILLPCTDKYENITLKSLDTIEGSGTILLVDDEEILRMTGQLMLEDMGYNVILAENGAEALEIYKKEFNRIDLVLLDMIMPKMNGKETFYELKKIQNDCKVVITSGYMKDERLDELTHNGLSGFIPKPYRDSDLSKMLFNILKM